MFPGRRYSRCARLCLSAAASLGWVLASVDGHLRAQGPLPQNAVFVPNELVVRFNDGRAPEGLPALLAQIGAVAARGFDSVDGLYVITLPPMMSVNSAGRLAERVDGVAYAEPNFLLKTQIVPNDVQFSTLWALHNTGQGGGTPGADIGAREAWDLTRGSSDVVVAIIDSGIDETHPDLAANLFRNEADCNANGSDDDGNGFSDDCHGIDTVNHDSNPHDDNDHGTHVAGTIGAVGNNGVGVVGVNWNVKLMPCKFLNASGSGSTADAIACLDYVARMKNRGANIVATNNSWGGRGFSQALSDAIDAQRQRCILFVVAPGNSSADNDTTPTFPASYDLPNVMSVASTTRTDTVSTFLQHRAQIRSYRCSRK